MGDDETSVFPGFEFSEPAGDSPFTAPRGRHTAADDKPPSKRPQRRGATRPPGSATLTTVWGLAGVALEQRGPMPVGPPVGRMMQLQAPDAGVRLARIVENSPLAEWLKPFSDNAGWLADLVPLLAPPLIVAGMAARPELVPMMEPMLGAILVPLAIELRKQQREAAQATELMGEMDDEITANVGRMLDMLLGPKIETKDETTDDA